MATGRRQYLNRQADLWSARKELASAPGHPLHKGRNAVSDEGGFDKVVENRCAKFSASRFYRPSLTPAIYFGSLLIGYFKGTGAERGIAWSLIDSLAP
ncbi:MAG: hypothetical protein ABR912_10985 [Terracidiphilus sp.]